MISAKYTIERDKHTLVVAGHARYAEYGKDIVCAGVSALVQALIGWVDNSDCTNECVSRDDINNEVVVSCVGDKAVEAAFSMTYIGLEQIANIYPNHLQVDKDIGFAY